MKIFMLVAALVVPILAKPDIGINYLPPGQQGSYTHQSSSYKAFGSGGNNGAGFGGFNGGGVNGGHNGYTGYYGTGGGNGYNGASTNTYSSGAQHGGGYNSGVSHGFGGSNGAGFGASNGAAGFGVFRSSNGGYNNGGAAQYYNGGAQQSHGGGFSGNHGSAAGSYGTGDGGYSSFGGVTNSVYFYDAPEDEVIQAASVRVDGGVNSQHNRVVFIKAPGYQTQQIQDVSGNVGGSGEKTKIYVLAKRPEAQNDVIINTASHSSVAKPEVHYIKYNTQQDAEEQILGSLNGQSTGSSVQSVESDHAFVGTIRDSVDTKSGGPIVHNIGGGGGSHIDAGAQIYGLSSSLTNGQSSAYYQNGGGSGASFQHGGFNNGGSASGFHNGGSSGGFNNGGGFTHGTGGGLNNGGGFTSTTRTQYTSTGSGSGSGSGVGSGSGLASLSGAGGNGGTFTVLGGKTAGASSSGGLFGTSVSSSNASPQAYTYNKPA